MTAPKGANPRGSGAGTKLELATNVPFGISYPLPSAILIGQRAEAAESEGVAALGEVSV